MTMDEFIDLCILCGCDYTKNIGGIGPVKAFKFIKDEKNIETVLDILKKKESDCEGKLQYIIPEKFLYQESRELFKNPDAETDKSKLEAQIKWNKPEEADLKDFLCNGKGFTIEKVEAGLKKLAGA